MSNGSDAPNPPEGLLAAGVADAHPPKSSSAVTEGCLVGLLVLVAAVEMGAPHPPLISFGVIREGTLPSSTFGATGFAASGAPQALVSAPPQGSNMLLLDCATIAGRAAGAAGAGFVAVGDERLKAELKAGGLCRGGDGILVGGEMMFLVEADAKLLNPSSPKRSFGIDEVAGFGMGGEEDWANAKFKLLDGCGAAAGFGAGGLVAVLEKKSPPLKGGGELIRAAEGAALLETVLEKPRPEKADDAEA